MEKKPNFLQTPLFYGILTVPNLFMAIFGAGFLFWLSLVLAFVMFWLVIICKIYRKKDDVWKVSRGWMAFFGVCYAAAFIISLVNI